MHRRHRRHLSGTTVGPQARFLRLELREARAQQVAAGGGLLVLAGLVVLLQVRAAVPDSRLPLHVDPSGFLGDIFHSWDASEDLGHRTGALIAYLPLASFFAAARALGISALGAQQVFFMAVLFLSALGMWFLFGLFWETPSQVGRWVAALLYAFNPYVLFNIEGSTTVLLLPYMAAPWVAILLIRGIRLRSFRHGLVAAALVAVAAPGVNAAVNAIFFVGCGTFLLAEVARTGFERRALVLAVSSTALCGLASLWWLGPFLSSLRSGGTEVFFQTDPISVGASRSSFREIFRLVGLWALYQGYKGVPYHATQNYFASVPVIIGTMLGLLTVFGAFVRTWSDRRTKALALLLVVSVPMAVSIHPVDAPTLTGAAYQWLFDNFVAFRAFRSNYKWVAPIALVYALLVPLIVCSASRRLRVLAGAAASAFVLANMVPFFDPGLMFPPGYRLGNVPDYWQDAGRWLDAQPGPGRVLMTPTQGFSVYTWGRPMGDIAPLVTDRPVVTPNIAPGTTPGGRQLIALAGEAARDPSIPYASVLDLLDVGFVLQRNDVDWSYYDSHPPERMRDFLRAQPGLRFERSFGMLDVYRVRRAPVGPVATARRPARITADGGLRRATDLFQPGTLALFDEPDLSNAALASIRASSTSGDRSGDTGLLLALDGSQETAWTPAPARTADQWLELRFTQPRSLRDVQLVVQPNRAGARPQRVGVSNGPLTKQVPLGPDGVARFDLEGEPSRLLRIEVPAEGAGGAAGIAELSVPGFPTSVLRYRAAPDQVASYRLDLTSTARGALRREIIVPAGGRYRIKAEVSVDAPGAGDPVVPRDAAIGDLDLLAGPTTVRVPVGAGAGTTQLVTEVDLRPGRYAVQTSASPRVGLRALDVIAVDQKDAQLRPLPVARKSPSSFTVDLQGRTGYLSFAETADELWSARHEGVPLPRAGAGNGYGNVWMIKAGTSRVDIAFDDGGPRFLWLAVSWGGLVAVAAGHAVLTSRRTR